MNNFFDALKLVMDHYDSKSGFTGNNVSFTIGDIAGEYTKHKIQECIDTNDYESLIVYMKPNLDQDNNSDNRTIMYQMGHLKHFPEDIFFLEQMNIDYRNVCNRLLLSFRELQINTFLNNE